MTIRFYNGKILLEIGTAVYHVIAIYDDGDKYYIAIHEMKSTTKSRIEPLFKYLDRITMENNYLNIKVIIPKTYINEK